MSKHESHISEAKTDEVAQVMAAADYAFDAHEHIAFCFTCVARTLDPEKEAALILRDVMGFTNREAAKILGVSESVLRHKLSDARTTMQESFADLCALVSKRGVCWQCKGLREFHPEDKRGPEVPAIGRDRDDSDNKYRHRLKIVSEANVDRGRAQAFHDLVWRRMAKTEEARDFEDILVAERGSQAHSV